MALLDLCLLVYCWLLHTIGDGVELRDRSYEDQRHRARGLNLMVAAIILWNTVYLAEAIETLKKKGVEVKEEYLQHLLPLGWEHINLTGDYQWNFKHIPATGQLRPLRTKIA